MVPLQVLMKDIVTPVPPEEVRSVIKKCLENAALVNYTRISEYAKIEGMHLCLWDSSIKECEDTLACQRIKLNVYTHMFRSAAFYIMKIV